MQKPHLTIVTKDAACDIIDHLSNTSHECPFKSLISGPARLSQLWRFRQLEGAVTGTAPVVGNAPGQMLASTNHPRDNDGRPRL